MTNVAIEHCHRKFLDLPSYKLVIFHNVNAYQRVTWYNLVAFHSDLEHFLNVTSMPLSSMATMAVSIYGGTCRILVVWKSLFLFHSDVRFFCTVFVERSIRQLSDRQLNLRKDPLMNCLLNGTSISTELFRNHRATIFNNIIQYHISYMCVFDFYEV